MTEKLMSESGAASSVSARERKLLELAFAFHVGIEGEYGCPGETCPGVQRLVAAMSDLEGLGRRERFGASSVRSETRQEDK